MVCRKDKKGTDTARKAKRISTERQNTMKTMERLDVQRLHKLLGDPGKK